MEAPTEGEVYCRDWDEPLMNISEYSEGIDLSIDVGRAYLYVILIVIPLVVVLSLIYSLIWGTENFFRGLGQLTTLPIILPVLIIGIPLHELLHAIGWSVIGKRSLKDVKFGVLWKALTPYAHLKDPIRASAYRAGTVTPLLIMGILPYILGLVMGNSWVANFGLIFVLAAGGDLLVILSLRRVHGGSMVIDHPSKVGCIVLNGEMPI